LFDDLHAFARMERDGCFVKRPPSRSCRPRLLPPTPGIVEHGHPAKGGGAWVFGIETRTLACGEEQDGQSGHVNPPGVGTYRFKNA